MRILKEKIRSIQPKDKRIVTLEEVKDYLKVEHDYDDELIGTFIDSAIGVVESIISKKVVKTNIVYTAVLEFTDDEVRDISCIENRGKDLRIRTKLKAAICTDYLYIGNEKVSHDDYVLTVEEVDFQRLIVKRGVFAGRIKDNRVEVTLGVNAGLFDCVDEVDSVIKTAVMMQVAEFYENRNYCYVRDKMFRRSLRQLLSYYINYVVI